MPVYALVSQSLAAFCGLTTGAAASGAAANGFGPTLGTTPAAGSLGGAGGVRWLAAASSLTMASVRCGWTEVGCAGTATSAGTTWIGVSASAVAVAAAAPAIRYERTETDTMAPRNDRVPTI